MMEALSTRSSKGTFDVRLSGGSPWGFTLQGGSEFNSKLVVAKITPGGKADQTKVLNVGDEVVAINGQICTTRADAIEIIRCSRQNIRVTIRRGSSPARQNGSHYIVNTRDHYTAPNLYSTALEVATGPADFFSTYSVDPDKYARVTEHSKSTKPKVNAEYSALSASNEDLLEAYWGANTKGSDMSLTSDTSQRVTNGRMSPDNDAPIVPAKHRQIINTLHARAQSWSERRGQSLPEGNLHSRHYTSPSRIQRVKVKSTNITSSPSSVGSDSESYSPVSRNAPSKPQHSPISRQPHVPERSTDEYKIPSSRFEERQSRDTEYYKKPSHDQDWFAKWLRDDKPYTDPVDQNVSVSATRSMFEEPPERDDRPPERTSNFSRSKSFSGRPSYGVVVTMKGDGKSAHPEVSAFQAPLPPNRVSSSDLVRDKSSRKSLPSNEFWKSSTSSLPVEVDSRLARPVASIPEGAGRSVEVRIPVSSTSAFISSSMTNLNTINDPNVSRKMGPAPPPRRSESKLLSSFRTRGKRAGPQVVSGSTRRPYNEPQHELREPPRHVASKSWPSDHLGDNSRTSVGEDRQSWHAQTREPRNREHDPRDSYQDPRERRESPRDRREIPRYEVLRERQQEPRDRYRDPRDRYQESRDRQPDPRDAQRYQEPRDRQPDPRDAQRYPRELQQDPPDARDRREAVRDVSESPRNKFPEPRGSQTSPHRSTATISVMSVKTSGPHEGDSRRNYRGSSSSSSYDDSESRPAYKVSPANNSFDFGSRSYRRAPANNSYDGGSQLGSSSGGYDDSRPVYRSASAEFQLEARSNDKAQRPHSARSRIQVTPIQTKPLQAPAPETGPSRIEDTEILQKLMRDSENNSSPSVQLRIESFERGSPQPASEEGPDVEQLRPRTQHSQATWDRQQRVPEPENRIRGTRTPPPIPPKKRSREEPVITVQRQSEPQEREPTAVKVTLPRRMGDNEDLSHQRVVVRTSPVSKQALSVAPVDESVTRSESCSEQEREVFIEEMFKKMEDPRTTNTAPKAGPDLSPDRSLPPPPPSVGDDEVFTPMDDSLPPPPPPTVVEHETSHDNLPLPSPPREVLQDSKPLEERRESPKPQIVQVKAIEPVEREKQTLLDEEIHKEESPPSVKTTVEYSTQERVPSPHRREEENTRNAYKLSRSMEDLSIDRGFGKEEYLSRVISESRKRFGDEHKRHSYHNDAVWRNREEHVRVRPISTTEKHSARQPPVETQVRLSPREEVTGRQPTPVSVNPGTRDYIDGRPSLPADKPDLSPSEKRSSFHEFKSSPVHEDDVLADEERPGINDAEFTARDEDRTSFYRENVSPPCDEKRNSFQDEKHLNDVEKPAQTSPLREETSRDDSSTSLSSTEREREFTPISPDRSLPFSETSSLDRTPEEYRRSRGEIPPPLVITSTPTREDRLSTGDYDTNRGFNSPFSDGSNMSTPSSSRPNSMVSPKLEQLDKEKGELVDSMKRKIEDLKKQMNEISEEIEENERLGTKVTLLVEGKTTTSEFAKYQRFTGELNKIVLLLLSLTQRMHRYEKTLSELDMSEEADRQQRDILQDKIEYVKNQYEEACKIKEVNDKRGVVVSKFLDSYLDEEEFADFQYYIDMKTQLALMHAEIRDKVKMGEERLNVLSTTEIDWSVTSLSSY